MKVESPQLFNRHSRKSSLVRFLQPLGRIRPCGAGQFQVRLTLGNCELGHKSYRTSVRVALLVQFGHFGIDRTLKNCQAGKRDKSDIGGVMLVTLNKSDNSDITYLVKFRECLDITGNRGETDMARGESPPPHKLLEHLFYDGNHMFII